MAALAKEIALITGANSGIGYEIARQLLAKGTYHVLLCSRSSQKGSAALQDLRSQNLPGSVELLTLDVQSDQHIHEAATSITQSHGKLDILVNNAGVALPSGATERERLQTAFDTNAAGPYLLAKALIPLLRKSANPRIINISSGAGSISRRLFPESPMYKIQGIPYRASKTALNMITSCLHVEYGLGIEQADGEKVEGEVEGKRMKVFSFDPGYTVSNLSEHNKTEFGARSAEETVFSIMDVVLGKRDADVGKFIHNSGEYPW
ncbi:NAD(P)-binding protein [Cucurbitaria berberidis CBS 394.84]|uniref:NAD(P)-binding protein n=1 Tax=Cucurbitaria berberidis CBS 394.84 TaxID=1168544 RepID=A0A9P4LAN5_9PLEO|nr:NAD(P)-binding protein [Cucurbitaria berberidis CBS 394.84]KAF1847703.1 NAD(P)-binding protein [Cucurbitaria berberidis CBS 394.84]